MSEIISSFRSKLDLDAVRERFPEISDSETPIWHGSPAHSVHVHDICSGWISICNPT